MRLLADFRSIKNRYDFTNLDEYAFMWEIYKNGEKISTGDFNVDLKPHEAKEIRLSLPVIPADVQTPLEPNPQLRNDE